jgi:hypothetical protein
MRDLQIRPIIKRRRATRPIRIDGNVAFVPLTRGFEAVIDAADAPLVGAFNWHLRVTGRLVYASRNDRSGGRNAKVQLHRFLLPPPDGMIIDHIDGDGLNNRRANLRLATNTTNAQNTRRRIDNTSGFKGVSWHPGERKWLAKIKVFGRAKHLGYFNDPEVAHYAYIAAASTFFGDFARAG